MFQRMKTTHPMLKSLHRTFGSFAFSCVNVCSCRICSGSLIITNWDEIHFGRFSQEVGLSEKQWRYQYGRIYQVNLSKVIHKSAQFQHASTTKCLLYTVCSVCAICLFPSASCISLDCCCRRMSWYLERYIRGCAPWSCNPQGLGELTLQLSITFHNFP